MPSGISLSVTQRLWNLLSAIQQKKSRKEIIKKLSYSQRGFAADLTKLKSAGIKIKYSRKTDIYSVRNWPVNKTFPFRFSSEEFFYVYYLLRKTGQKKFADKLGIAISEETDPVYDCGPAYGIGGNITGMLAPLLEDLKNAIVEHRKTVLNYTGLKGEEKLRVVHPLKLIHTPISWYLVAFCEDRKDFRKFKLARMKSLKVLDDKFKKADYNLEEILGDAWWVQCEPKQKPYEVKVLFKNETARSIKEYNFHKTQKLEDTPNGTLASWKLSYLGEFASWLMQWLGDIEIIEPKELKKLVETRIAKYTK